MGGRLRLPRLGLLAALLAVAAQLAVGAVVPSPLMGFGDNVICHADGPPGSPQQHHGPLPMRCPFCAAMATPAPLLAKAPPVMAVARVSYPFAAPPRPATGPPTRFVFAAQPRGPPSRA